MIAKELRVCVRSVERWRRAWREGGMGALRSAGPANAPTVTDERFAVLEKELGKGPSAHGFEDER
ncbi:helix-turn-helix domain-containing protein [Streptomyces sp. NPDC048550]|uniref:helix-turn-helix domain-containing protein n=1 Tax=Streptomyces sp. NPDC048550 TaxID=3155739 RepID=UPI003443AE68